MRRTTGGGGLRARRGGGEAGRRQHPDAATANQPIERMTTRSLIALMFTNPRPPVKVAPT